MADIKVGDEVTVNDVWMVVDEVFGNSAFAIDEDGKDHFLPLNMSMGFNLNLVNITHQKEMKKIAQ